MDEWNNDQGPEHTSPAGDGSQPPVSGQPAQSPPGPVRTSSARVGPPPVDEPDPVPWEVPGAPFFSALLETVKLFALDPKAAFVRLEETEGWQRPMAYAVLVTTISSAVAAAFMLMLQLPFILATISQAGGEPLGVESLSFGAIMLLVFVGVVVMVPISTVISLLVQAGILHLILLMLSIAQERFEATLRLVCYAATGQIGNLVPFVGGYIALPWLIVLQVLGVAQTHRCTYGKATLAVLLPLIVCCGLTIGMVVVIFALIISAAAGAS
jgi:hypothetical protein